MAKTIDAWEDIHLDIFEALKRALIHQGFVPSARAKQGVIVRPQPLAKKAASPTNEGVGKLLDVTISAHDVLFEANTVFPFTLFPDTVTLDRQKLTIAKRLFFRVAKIASSPIADIQSAQANVGPFFGSIQLTSRFFFTNQRSVNFLWRRDALRLQHLLQGYIIAHEKHVDCTQIPTHQLIELLDDLGQGTSE